MLSVKEMMERVGLKGRDNFLSQHLDPAIAERYVRLFLASHGSDIC